MRTLITTAAAALVAALLLAPSAAQADSRVTVRNDFGRAEADTTYSTKITVTGSGFQSIRNAHGGVYVAFGTVSGTWRPSQGGVTGKNYRYVPDSETRSNQGFLRYVAYPGSDTAASANGGTLKGGGFSTTLTIPGPVFKTYDRDNKITTVDCRKVRCGVITFGAHGIKNANNETFTPVTFKKIITSDTAQQAPAADEAAPGAVADEESAPEAAAKGAPAKKGRPAVRVDQRTAVQGRVLAFSGTGFTPGEQVLAILDDGAAAAGPIVVGARGDVAAVIQIPASAKAGTHTLRLSATTSGTEVERNFAIAPDTSLAAATDEETTDWVPWAAAAAAAVILLLSLVLAVVRLRRIRAGRAA
ncbi:hypothetical protein GEV29_00560 [Aeromicrobium sp. SMF47]|uniref:hypothetical protein n=1 Tax=Aeromicrobium yanjiei TaxID=2662028 RepID=UPI00129DB4A3|nr:hypothetical protein [Aeromicrobium yanjiei]MRJ75020.1 hypothetical protein [Aeromicrobium yanjiei]